MKFARVDMTGTYRIVNSRIAKDFQGLVIFDHKHETGHYVFLFKSIHFLLENLILPRIDLFRQNCFPFCKNAYKNIQWVLM